MAPYIIWLILHILCMAGHSLFMLDLFQTVTTMKLSNLVIMTMSMIGITLIAVMDDIFMISVKDRTLFSGRLLYVVYHTLLNLVSLFNVVTLDNAIQVDERDVHVIDKPRYTMLMAIVIGMGVGGFIFSEYKALFSQLMYALMSCVTMGVSVFVLFKTMKNVSINRHNFQVHLNGIWLVIISLMMACLLTGVILVAMYTDGGISVTVVIVIQMMNTPLMYVVWAWMLTMHQNALRQKQRRLEKEEEEESISVATVIVEEKI